MRQGLLQYATGSGRFNDKFRPLFHDFRQGGLRERREHPPLTVSGKSWTGERLVAWVERRARRYNFGMACRPGR